MSRILLDENLPVPMRALFPTHEVEHVKTRGWGGISNGKLIALADAAGFEVLVTADRNLRYQQNLVDRSLALVVLSTNRWVTIRSNAARVGVVLDGARPGTVQEVDLLAPAEHGPGQAGAT